MLARNLEHSMFRQPRRPMRAAQRLPTDRVLAARRGYVTRRIPHGAVATLLSGHRTPASGDLVLVRVSTLGRFRLAELADARLSELNPGVELIACYADAPSESSAAGVALQLASPAGIVAPALHRFGEKTLVELLGTLGDAEGKPLNIADWAAPSGMGRFVRQPVIALVGDMHLPDEPCRAVDIVRGLAASGFNVGAANITSVPGCWKTRLLYNAGASNVLDISDAGYVTTRGQGAAVVESIFLSLIGYLSASGADVIVLEIEKDVFDHDAATLVTLPAVQERVSTVILEGREGTGSELERDSLRALGFDVTLVDEPGHRPRYRRLI